MSFMAVRVLILFMSTFDLWGSQVREENPILYSHKTQLNIKLSLLQHYNNMFRPKLSAIFRLYMKPI